MGVTGILHTGLTVSDLDRSLAFYRDLLGLELIAQWDRAFFFSGRQRGRWCGRGPCR